MAKGILNKEKDWFLKSKMIKFRYLEQEFRGISRITKYNNNLQLVSICKYYK